MGIVAQTVLFSPGLRQDASSLAPSKNSLPLSVVKRLNLFLALPPRSRSSLSSADDRVGGNAGCAGGNTSRDDHTDGCASGYGYTGEDADSAHAGRDGHTDGNACADGDGG
jgi:hypothetical protein